MKRLILIMALLTSTLVMGAELKKHMIITSTSGSAIFMDEGEGGYELSTINLAAGYYYAFNKYFQVGAQGSYTIYGSMDDTMYTINPGVKFSIPLNEKDGIMDSVFIGLNVGYMGSTGEVMNVSEMFYTAEIGKRFKLLENLSYSPSVSVHHMDTGPGTSNETYSLNFLKLSIHF